MRPSRPAFTVLLLLTASASVASAQDVRIRPLVLVEDDPVFGVHATGELTRERVLIGPYPKNFFWSVAAGLPWFTKPERNPEPQRIQFDGGLQISLFRPSTPVGAAPSPDDPPPWNFGYVAFQLGVGAEAPQDVNMADVTIGASFAYEHDQYHSLWFMPELRIAYDAVFCIDCDLTVIADAPAPDDAGWRLAGELGWNIPADRAWMPALLKPIWLRLDGRAFHTSGLDEFDELHNDDGLWGSAELAYRCDRCGPVHEVYVRGNGGRLPQRLREKRTWTAGVSLAF